MRFKALLISSVAYCAEGHPFYKLWFHTLVHMDGAQGIEIDEKYGPVKFCGLEYTGSRAV